MSRIVAARRGIGSGGQDNENGLRLSLSRAGPTPGRRRDDGGRAIGEQPRKYALGAARDMGRCYSVGQDMFHEHDCVVLTQDIPDEGLKAGDVGMVVRIHRNAAANDIEFFALTGQTVAVAREKKHPPNPGWEHALS